MHALNAVALELLPPAELDEPDEALLPQAVRASRPLAARTPIVIPRDTRKIVLQSTQTEARDHLGHADPHTLEQ
jgi:hypothetical protein